MHDGTLKTTWKQIRRHPLTIGAQSVADNIAWLSFAAAATFIPISIANTISGGYVALAACLGLLVNKEKVKPHQLAGIAFVSLGVIALSYLYA